MKTLLIKRFSLPCFFSLLFFTRCICGKDNATPKPNKPQGGQERPVEGESQGGGGEAEGENRGSIDDKEKKEPVAEISNVSQNTPAPTAPSNSGAKSSSNSVQNIPLSSNTSPSTSSPSSSVASNSVSQNTPPNIPPAKSVNPTDQVDTTGTSNNGNNTNNAAPDNSQDASPSLNDNKTSRSKVMDFIKNKKCELWTTKELNTLSSLLDTSEDLDNNLKKALIDYDNAAKNLKKEIDLVSKTVVLADLEVNNLKRNNTEENNMHYNKSSLSKMSKALKKILEPNDPFLNSESTEWQKTDAASRKQLLINTMKQYQEDLKNNQDTITSNLKKLQDQENNAKELFNTALDSLLKK